MQFSEAPSASSTLSEPNGNRKHNQLSVGPTSATGNRPPLVSTKDLSRMWDMPESTLRYWRCAGIGPPYVKLGGRIKYDLADVEDYVRANKRKPSVRAHGG
jgi:Helix-turn-helix domain